MRRNSTITLFVLAAFSLLQLSFCVKDAIPFSSIFKPQAPLINSFDFLEANDLGDNADLDFEAYLTHYSYSATYTSRPSTVEQAQTQKTTTIYQSNCSSSSLFVTEFSSMTCSLYVTKVTQTTLTSQSITLYISQASNYSVNPDNSSVIFYGLPSTLLSQTSTTNNKQSCEGAQVSYNFINSDTQSPYNFTLDEIGVLALQVVFNGGSCAYNIVTPPLDADSDDSASAGLLVYVSIATTAGIIPLIVCSYLIKRLARNPNLAKRISIGSLCFVVTFDVYMYFTHFTYWTSISVWMAPVFITFFVLSVFFEPVLLYSVFISLQRRNQASVYQLLGQLYSWIMVTAACLVLSLVWVENAMFYAFPVFLFPQILDNFNRKQKHRWNPWFICGMGLPKIAIIMYRALDPSKLFGGGFNPKLLGVTLGLFVIQLILLKIQTKYPCFGLKKYKEYSYLCTSDEIGTLSHEVCSICCEQVHSPPLIGLQQPLMEQNKDNTNTDILRTPCNHFFHGPCLKEWAKKKLECPNCRQKIPSLGMEEEDEAGQTV